ncbi:MAG: efflux RND transporter periplasmic adaptor subunit [Acidobacteriota bacterium]|nr:efflux RND transporter periplasmic adaptor subunit [Acidobacteriota bacterium]
MSYRFVGRSLSWVLVFTLAASVGCVNRAPEETIEFRVPVTARAVETGDVEDRIVATGSLRTPEAVALNADSGGALKIARNARGRRFAEGDRVKAGDIVGEITGEEVRLAAGLEAAEQRYATVKADYDSKKALYDEGLLAEQEFRQVESSLADAKIEVERGVLKETRSRLITPIDGVILRLARDESEQPLADGQLVMQGFQVAQIAPTDTLIAEVDLVGSDVARIKVGQIARVRHHAWDDSRFEGRVLRLAPSLDPSTRTLRAEVAVRNGAAKLRPGMFVEVTIVVESRPEVPVVPRRAVAERNSRKVVFVVEGQKVRQREVVLGLGDDEIVEIIEGLEPEERIVVQGIETLNDNMSVRVNGG